MLFSSFACAMRKRAHSKGTSTGDAPKCFFDALPPRADLLACEVPRAGLHNAERRPHHRVGDVKTSAGPVPGDGEEGHPGTIRRDEGGDGFFLRRVHHHSGFGRVGNVDTTCFNTLNARRAALRVLPGKSCACDTAMMASMFSLSIHALTSDSQLSPAALAAAMALSPAAVSQLSCSLMAAAAGCFLAALFWPFLLRLALAFSISLAVFGREVSS